MQRIRYTRPSIVRACGYRCMSTNPSFFTKRPSNCSSCQHQQRRRLNVFSSPEGTSANNATMKEAMVGPGPKVKVVDSPIPEPGSHDVVIKVEVCGSNPKDWKIPDLQKEEKNSGDDIAGTIHTVGSAVGHLFRPGQRVAGFHRLRTPHGAYAEYAVAPAYCTFAIPDHTRFEEAATLPLAAMTAAFGLFARLELPEPWSAGGKDGNREEGKKPGPLIVYGAAGAVGAYAVQLAKKAGIGPILCVAGRGIPFVEKMLDKSSGDAVVDYRGGDDAVVSGLQNALKAIPGSPECFYAFDAVSEKNSYVNIGKVLSKGGKITVVLPVKEGIPEGITKSSTLVGAVHDSNTLFGKAWFALFSQGLSEGWLKPHPHEVVPGGLNGVETGLSNLKAGKASAVKYVFRISETKGIDSKL